MADKALQQAQEDLALVERHLAALGVVLAAAAFTIAERLKAESKLAKVQRQAEKRARKAASEAR